MHKTSALLPGDLNRLNRETGMLLATVDSLSDEEFLEPSLCQGWTRAHVVAHLIGHAHALGRLVEWALDGQPRQAYESRQARDAEIEQLATESPAILKKQLRTACDEFAALAARMRAGVKAEQVTNPDGKSITPYILPALRTSEVIVHHNDLGTTWELDEADMDAQEDALELLADRLSEKPGVPGLTITTDEGDEYVFGDGAAKVRGERCRIIAWVARGITEGVRSDGELPKLPTPAIG